MGFLDNLQTSTNKQARTENGALTNISTLDPLLDFFSRAGAMRGRETEAVDLFKKAFASDKENALKCLFYLRDIRGGQGERSVFRAILDSLDEDTLQAVVEFIPEYGRWDEVPVNENTIFVIDQQLNKDEANMAEGKPVSLLAKWLPSENTSSKETRKKAEKVMKLLNLKPSQYRRKVVALRKYIKLLEQQMSSKEWAAIQYDKIPSQAHRKHVKAFKRNDESRYEKFLGDVKTGEKKINASTLFTYEIYDMLTSRPSQAELDAADALWNALPDYTNGKNALVLADVSGSMTGRPMSISVSLALYFAERNKGLYNGYYMTFSDIPLLQKVNGDNIYDKFNFIEETNVGYNTNLEAAFDAILKAAVDSKASVDELPKVLYIISDMEFDAQMSGCDETNFESAKRKFAEAGYELPHVVFWNVDARNEQSPATKFDNQVTMISGSNQSTFRYAVEGKTPLESMMDILNSERYAQIKV